MQNKGAIKLLAILLGIACAYQLSFTFVTRSVERKAAAYAAGNPVKEQRYLDSIKSKPIYNLGLIKFNYKQSKDKEINLGLDLRGGMNVMLQISVEDVVRALANNSKDPVFNEAMNRAVEAQLRNSTDFIAAFASAYDELSGGKSLSAIFNTPELRDQITPNSSNEEVIAILRAQTNSAIDNSYNVLRNRIDRFGVTQPNIQKLDNGRVLVELPGVKEPDRVRKLLQGTANLEFWSTYNNLEIYPGLVEINNLLSQINAAGAESGSAQNASVQNVQESVGDLEPGATREDVIARIDSLLPELNPTGVEATANDAEMLAQYPLFSKLNPYIGANGMPGSGPVVGYARTEDMAFIDSLLNMPQVRALVPRDVKFMWGNKPMDEAETVYELYAIKANTRDGKAPLDGAAVAEAHEQYTQKGSSAEVSMTMTASGARTWARLTADNIDNFIAIVLDGHVYSAPGVHSEITGGQSSITGNFTIEEARDLANVLKSGKLPAPARIIQDTVVGPSLGQESINASMISFLVAFVLILLYMFAFYSRAGLAACVALICNLFYLFGVLVSFRYVLTLPGMAGIVLTMGMAVDANVLIYERIKEELRAGKGLSLAIADGYKNAMSAIIDGNLTTLIVGIILALFGTGPIQGFATTLIIGIITSLFTSIFITRMIFESRLAKGKKISFSNRFTENFLGNTKIDFIKIRKFSYIISGALILISIVSLSTRGLNYGVDFSGGRSFVVRFDQPVQSNDVYNALAAVFAEASGGDETTKSIEVKQYGTSGNQVRILTQYKFDDQSEDATTEVESLLHRALGPLYATPLTFEEFTTTATNPNGIISADKVGPSVASDITRNAFIAVFFSLFAIGVYIIARFKRWEWGVGSVIAQAHNVLLTMGAFSLLYSIMPFSMEIDQAFIAALLTIISYTINDNIVIFDRIREYNRLFPKRNDRENINNAINSTLSRTVNTMGTTLVVLTSIFLFGGDVIRGFIFALLFGIVVGSYSSVFVATPIAYDLIKEGKKREKKERKAASAKA